MPPTKKARVNIKKYGTKKKAGKIGIRSRYKEKK